MEYFTVTITSCYNYKLWTPPLQTVPARPWSAEIGTDRHWMPKCSKALTKWGGLGWMGILKLSLKNVRPFLALHHKLYLCISTGLAKKCPIFLGFCAYLGWFFWVPFYVYNWSIILIFQFDWAFLGGGLDLSAQGDIHGENPKNLFLVITFYWSV